MSGIYVCGNAGVGKSHFTKIMAAKYGLCRVGEIIRASRPLVDDSVRAVWYFNAYCAVHRDAGPYTICDRSVVDTMIWNRLDLWPEVKNLPPPSLVILPPVPSEDTIRENIDFWWSVDARREPYMRRWGLSSVSDSSVSLPAVLYHQFALDYEIYRRGLEYLGWRHLLCKSCCSYFDWQFEAEVNVSEVLCSLR